MSLNWKEIDLVLEELDLPGCFVRQVKEPDYRHLQMELYRPGNKTFLLISLAPGRTRLHSVEKKRKTSVSTPPFESLLKSRIKNGKIIKAFQLGEERIVCITVSKGEQQTNLWVRLWGNAANIIAEDGEGTILDAFYRRPSRGEVAGGKFDPKEAIMKTRSQSKKEFSIRNYPADIGFNKFLEMEYRRMEEDTRRKNLENRAVQIYEGITGKVKRNLTKLQKQMEDFSDFPRYKEWGDIIISNIHKISPGQSWLDAEDFYNENRPVRIQLDPNLSPEENSGKYYELYKKEKSGYENLKERIKNQRHNLIRQEKQFRQLMDSNSLEQLESYIEKHRRESKKPEDEGKPGLTFSSNNFTILVGRTANENDQLLRKHVRGNDYWLHARDYPGAYVFIKDIPGKSVPLEVLLDAGNLALYYSKGRNSGKGEVYYTRVKYLRRAKGEKKGTVLPTQEKNLSIRLDKDKISNIM